MEGKTRRRHPLAPWACLPSPALTPTAVVNSICFSSTNGSQHESEYTVEWEDDNNNFILATQYLQQRTDQKIHERNSRHQYKKLHIDSGDEAERSASRSISSIEDSTGDILVKLKMYYKDQRGRIQQKKYKRPFKRDQTTNAVVRWVASVGSQHGIIADDVMELRGNALSKRTLIKLEVGQPLGEVVLNGNFLPVVVDHLGFFARE